MISKTFSAALNGIEAGIVEVEVYISSGHPTITIVGLPDAAVKESKDRVVAAIKNSGFDFPYAKKIVANLAPADLKKEGGAFDLPIALCIIAAIGRINKDKLKEFCIIGELALEGKIRKARGALPIALSLQKSRLKKFIVPFSNRQESAVINTIEVFPFKTLAETAAFINGELEIQPYIYDCQNIQSSCVYDKDFSDIKGQNNAKRAAEISAAGSHNMIMLGPPGSGKTMLAQRMPSILPPMTFEESVETTKIHSASGQNFSGGLIRERPFRNPHHSSSAAALAGGGAYPKPGEISLAHNGVLFLDEFAEFRRDALEILRQPLENRYITVSRARASMFFPASFMLIAAMNPCPCGNLGSPHKQCLCLPRQVQRYKNKVSGPLLDRIDIYVEMPALKVEELANWSPTAAESSYAIKQRIIEARQIQNARFKNSNIFSNAQMEVKDIMKYCIMEDKAANILKIAAEKLKFSARAYDKILKVSRSIADLDKSETIKSVHISEAVQYRAFDGK